MSNLDLFIVNVALPSIGADFGGSLARLSWILNGYAIAFAALLIAAGRLGDRIGQRRVFLAGVAVFTLASALCAAAPNLGVLVAARVLQAAGAAALIPTSLALLLAATPVHKRAGAVRGWAAIGGVSAALGPVAGGLLVQADWRWVFLVNLPIGIAAIVAGRIVLPHPAARPGRAAARSARRRAADRRHRRAHRRARRGARLGLGIGAHHRAVRRRPSSPSAGSWRAASRTSGR